MHSQLLTRLFLLVLATVFVAADLLTTRGYNVQASLEADPSEAAKEAASDASSLPSYDLVVVVPSHATEHAEWRTAMRETWMQYLNKSAVNCTPCLTHKVRVIFVVGKEGNASETKAEAAKHDDLHVLDDFATPAARTGAAELTQRAIRWAVEHLKFKLLLKVDVHSWVFLDRLLVFLETRQLFEVKPSRPGVYAGAFPLEEQKEGAEVVVQEPTPVELEPRNTTAQRGSRNDTDAVAALLAGDVVRPHRGYVPLYADGAGYLLSPDLCEFIAGMGAASEDTSGAPKWGDDYGWAPVPRLLLLPREDVAVGFWLQPVNHTKVRMPVSSKNEACTKDPQKQLVVDSGFNLLQMRMRWFGIAKANDACHLERPIPKAPSHAKVSFLHP